MFAVQVFFLRGTEEKTTVIKTNLITSKINEEFGKNLLNDSQ